MGRAAGLVLCLAVLALSAREIVDHARAGDLFSFSWGPSPERQAKINRDVAEFRLDHVDEAMAAVDRYAGGYDTGDVEWNREIRFGWQGATSYCVEIVVEGDRFHRVGPSREGATPGPCPPHA